MEEGSAVLTPTSSVSVLQLRFDAVRTAVSGATPRPIAPFDNTRGFWTDVLRPFDTAVHAEVASFKDDLKALGVRFGQDIASALYLLATCGLARSAAPIHPTLLQWLQSAPVECHTFLGTTTGNLLTTEAVSIVRGNQGRASQQPSTAFSPKVLQQHSRRPPLLNDATIAKLRQIAPLPPNVLPLLQQAMRQILEFRDGLLMLAYEIKRQQSIPPSTQDGKSIGDFLSDNGLNKVMPAIQLYVRRLLGHQMLPVS